ncbi:MAG: A/G-specific adenine glycosylase [Gemmatimonadetes bacterium]|nr:A/G-specific adenine glycosylase [Gemmatimonadota bacterium]
MPPKSTPELRAFRQRLMRWFRRKGRDLPWRRTRDPYRVLVSEFMLQQTQVSRVTEYYPRFLARYPTIQALARATPQGVHAMWQGLGYYRRAANLHRLAQTVVAEHDGMLPEDPVALRRLPGVGRYTAGAVATFAFEQAHPAVDTNVGRVIRRAFIGGGRQPGKRGSGETENKAGRAKEERRVWELAQLLVPRAGNPAWTFNQAIMELGALVCTARVAKCGECPVRGVCRTGKQGNGEMEKRGNGRPGR